LYDYCEESLNGALAVEELVEFARSHDATIALRFFTR
jgi:hypothetical protein